MALVLLLLSCGRGSPVAAPPQAAYQLAETRHQVETLKADLHWLDGWIGASYPALAGVLRPGLTDEQIDALMRGTGLRLPSELRVLYRWHDGSSDTSSVPFLFYHRWLSLAESKRRRRGGWWPVLEFDGECLFVLLDDQARGGTPVLHMMIEDTEARVAFTNITRMIATHRRWIERGACRVNPRTAVLSSDQVACRKIHAPLNPGATYPYYVR